MRVKNWILNDEIEHMIEQTSQKVYDYVSDMKMTEIEQDFEMDTTAGPDVANKVAKLISETTARGKISE